MNESCTIFLKNGNGFDRFFIPNCHWQESKASNVPKSGLQSADRITVYILVKDTPDELQTALNSRKAAAQDVIVKGECNFTFDGSSQQKASESLKQLNTQYDTHTVMNIDRLMYGSKNLQHFKISANTRGSR